MGTRHRAALGISEESDAVVVVVSEETQKIAVAYQGMLYRNVDEDSLRALLSRLFFRGSNNS
jgi:diadenylate cyclase